ncbi:hypothetical protein BpHYR1_035663, partial [Brachionus plicatilis]
QKQNMIRFNFKTEIDCKFCKIVAEILTSSLSEDKKLHVIDSLLKAKKNEKATDNSMSNNKKESKKENISSTSLRNSKPYHTSIHFLLWPLIVTNLVQGSFWCIESGENIQTFNRLVAVEKLWIINYNFTNRMVLPGSSILD